MAEYCQRLTGLFSVAARQRLAEEGCNELPSTVRRNALAIALRVAREAIFCS
jgi:hypothetical protein